LSRKIFTDEELRERKNKQARERYAKDAEYRKASAEYHAALYASRKTDPEFLKKNAEKVAAQRAANPEKARQSLVKSRLKHAEKRRAEVREWYANNKDKRAMYEQNRRARKRGDGGGVDANFHRELMARQRGKCACCAANLGHTKPNLDHIIPLARGGKHERTNLQLLCWRCNNQKHSKDPVEFMQSRGFLL